MNYLANRIEDDILIFNFQVAAIVDSLSVESVSNEWMQELESSSCKKLIIDFSSLEFMSSGLIGELIQLRAFCLAKGVTLKLSSLTKEMEQVFSLARLSEQFKTYRSQRSAIECFAADNFVARQRFFASYAAQDDTETHLALAMAAPTLELFPEPANSPFNF